jgi:hypothetical protein
MKHLTDDQLYDLARKVNLDADFTPEEALALQHIADCDECYHLLCCMMAMEDVSRNIGEYAEKAPARARISAVIQLAVHRVNTALDQLEAGGWTFRTAPMAMAGARSLGKRTGAVKKLTDPDNSQTFVAYDAAKQLLMIQVDSADSPEPPKATIFLPEGGEIAVTFEKREHLFWAEIPGLPEGEYQIRMEK